MKLRYLILLLLLASPSYSQSSPDACDLPLDELIQVYEAQLDGTPFKHTVLTIDDGQATLFVKEVYSREKEMPQDIDLVTVFHITNPTETNIKSNMLLFSYKDCVVAQYPETDKFIKDVIDTIHKNGA